MRYMVRILLVQLLKCASSCATAAARAVLRGPWWRARPARPAPLPAGRGRRRIARPGSARRAPGASTRQRVGELRATSAPAARRLRGAGRRARRTAGFLTRRHVATLVKRRSTTKARASLARPERTCPQMPVTPGASCVPRGLRARQDRRVWMHVAQMITHALPPSARCWTTPSPTTPHESPSRASRARRATIRR